MREKIIAALQKVLVTEGKYELAAILRELLDYLATELDFDFTNDQDVPTHFGKALNARASAQGLRYPFRTKKYLLATLKALENPQVKEVLYLGTGPFAPFFVFPILLGYTQARFTLVEVTRCRMLCSDSTCSPPWQGTSKVATGSADGALPGSIDEGVGCWRIFDSIGSSHVDHHSRSDQTLRAN